MLDTLYTRLFLALVVAIGVFSFAKGDEPERLGMGAYLLGWLASILVQDDGLLYRNFQWKLFALDLAMCTAFGFIVWRSRRSWAVWATAIQLLVVMSHVVYLVDVRPPIAAFYTVLNLASYAILLTLGIGTFWAWQERRAAGLE